MSKPILFLAFGISLFLFSGFLLFQGGFTQAVIASFGLTIGLIIVGLAAHAIKTSRGK